MKISVGGKQLKKALESQKELQKKYGPRNAKKIQQRIFEIAAATNLSELKSLPSARCHQLSGDRERQYAVDLVNPFRLVFEALCADEIFDEKNVTEVIILEVVDYH